MRKAMFAILLMLVLLCGGLPVLSLRGTFPALAALRDAGLITSSQYNDLHDAYLFCTRVRLRLHMQSGRPSDSLPLVQEATSRLAASLGFERSGEMREQYMRVTRRSRRAFEAIFYD